MPDTNPCGSSAGARPWGLRHIEARAASPRSCDGDRGALVAFGSRARDGPFSPYAGSSGNAWNVNFNNGNSNNNDVGNNNRVRCVR